MFIIYIYISIKSCILQSSNFIEMYRIAIFASGNGSNTQKIIEYFKEHKHIKIVLVCTDKRDAFVLERTKRLNVQSFVFSRDELRNSEIVIEKLKDEKIDFIVLAGFMLLVPANILNAFPDHIINIHPALLPKFGGKGMYGMHVHEAVINANEKESGISIHYVNERYDEGKIIFQAKVPIDKNETPDSLASKIHELEYKYYPEVIEKIVKDSEKLN